MGWGHQASCPDCQHTWEWLSTSAYLGTWPLVPDAKRQAPIHGWYCLGCHRQLFFPIAIERKSWRTWHEGFLVGEGLEPPTAYMRELAAKVDDHLGYGNPEIPVSINFHPGSCPACHQSFERIREEEDRLVCPRCNGQTAFERDNSTHYSIAFDEFGFS